MFLGGPECYKPITKARPKSERGPSTMLEDLRILVVDDDATIRRLVEHILRGVGVTALQSAGSADLALAVVAKWRPDVLLVDYVMEGIDGITFTRLVRKTVDTAGRRLPIVIMTGYAELWRLDQAKKAGADEFLVKPFTAKALLSRIRRAVDASRRLAQGNHTTADSPA